MFNIKKNNMFFINFGINESRSITRNIAEQILLKYGYKREHTTLSQEQYYQKLSNYKFVISPLGSGFDCYRHWESFYLGSIPITTQSPIYKIFENLPIIILNDWNEFSPELIEQKYKELVERKDKIEWNKMFAPYWYDKIFRQRVKGQEFPGKIL